MLFYGFYSLQLYRFLFVNLTILMLMVAIMNQYFNLCKKEYMNFLECKLIAPDKIKEHILQNVLAPVYADFMKEHEKKQYLAVTMLSVLERKRQACYFIAMKELHNAFKQEDIKLVFLKGVLLGNDLYPENIVRTTTDIDVLIGQEHIYKAIEIVNQLGYTAPDGNRYTADAIIKDGGDHHVLPAHKIFLYHGKAYVVCIEMHLHFTKSYGTARRRYAKLNPLEYFYGDDITANIIANAVPYHYLDAEFYVLDPLDNICFNADHFAHHCTDYMVASLIVEDNTWKPPCNRILFDTMLLFAKHIKNDADYAALVTRIIALDTQSQLGIYLVLKCCSVISVNIVSNERLLYLYEQIRRPSFASSYELLLHVLSENIDVFLLNQTKEKYRAVRKVTRLLHVKNRYQLNESMEFSRSNCNIVLPDNSISFEPKKDCGNLRTTIKISKTDDGLHFCVTFTDDTFVDFSNDHARLVIHIVFSGQKDIQNRNQYIMVATNQDEVWASHKAGEFIQRVTKSCRKESGFTMEFDTTWVDMNINECIPNRLLFMVAMFHFTLEGEQDYMLCNAGIPWDIENFIEIDITPCNYRIFSPH